jgi:hypothetical protein
MRGMELATIIGTGTHVVGIGVVAIKVGCLLLIVGTIAFDALRDAAHSVAAVVRRRRGRIDEAPSLEGRGKGYLVPLWLACAVVIGVAEAVVIHPSIGGDVMVGTFMAFPAVWFLLFVGAMRRAVVESRDVAAEPSARAEPGAKTLAA